MHTHSGAEPEILIWGHFLFGGIKIVFLPDCPLVLSLLKHRNVGAFLNK